jgi:hypothetical protein
MDRLLARQIVDLTLQASRLLDESVATVRDGAPVRAASVYKSAVARAMGEMADILFRMWREHPDLEPAAIREGPSTYNARDFQMPPGVAAEAVDALRRATEVMEGVGAILQQEPDSAVRDACQAELTRVRQAIHEARRGADRQIGSPDGGRRTDVK